MDKRNVDIILKRTLAVDILISSLDISNVIYPTKIKKFRFNTPNSAYRLIAVSGGKCCYVFQTSKVDLSLLNAEHYFDEPQMEEEDEFRLIFQINKFGGGGKSGNARVHKKEIRFSRFSPNGKKIVTVGEDLKIAVWSVANKKILRVFEGHKDEIFDGRFLGNDNSYFFTCSADGSIMKWNIKEGTKGEMSLKENSSVRGLDHILINGSYRLAAANADGSVGFWNLDNSVRIGSVEPDEQWKKSRKFVSNVGLVDPQRYHTGPLFAAKFSRNGFYLATASHDSTCKLWNILSLRRDKVKGNESKQAGDINNDLVALEDDSSNIKIREETPLFTGFQAILLHTMRHEAPCRHIAFTVDSEYLISASADSTLKVWLCESGEQVFQVNLPSPLNGLEVFEYPVPIKDIEDEKVKLNLDNYSQRITKIAAIIQNRIIILNFEKTNASSNILNVKSNSDDGINEVQKASGIVDSIFEDGILPGQQERKKSVLQKGITRSDLKQSIAQAYLAPDFLSVLSKEGNINEDQLKANMKKYNLDETTILRIIASCTTYKHQDILNALSESDSQKANLIYTELITGNSIEPAMIALGYLETLHADKLPLLFVEIDSEEHSNSSTMVYIKSPKSTSQQFEKLSPRPPNRKDNEGDNGSSFRRLKGFRLNTLVSPRNPSSPRIVDSLTLNEKNQEQETLSIGVSPTSAGGKGKGKRKGKLLKGSFTHHSHDSRNKKEKYIKAGNIKEQFASLVGGQVIPIPINNHNLDRNNRMDFPEVSPRALIRKGLNFKKHERSLCVSKCLEAFDPSKSPLPLDDLLDQFDKVEIKNMRINEESSTVTEKDSTNTTIVENHNDNNVNRSEEDQKVTFNNSIMGSKVRHQKTYKELQEEKQQKQKLQEQEKKKLIWKNRGKESTETIENSAYNTKRIPGFDLFLTPFDHKKRDVKQFTSEVKKSQGAVRRFVLTKNDKELSESLKRVDHGEALWFEEKTRNIA